MQFPIFFLHLNTEKGSNCYRKEFASNCRVDHREAKQLTKLPPLKCYLFPLILRNILTKNRRTIEEIIIYYSMITLAFYYFATKT